MAYKETFSTLSRRDKSFLDLALKLAETSSCIQRHGAVIVKSGSVLSLGVNKMKNDPRYIPWSPTKTGICFSVHAEIDALKRVSDPRGATIYIARLGKGGKPSMSRPCDRCAKALMEAGIKSVVYT